MFYKFYNHIKNKYFDELKKLPAVTREAEIFRRTCEEIPISIEPEDAIAGRYGCPEGLAPKGNGNKNFDYVDAYIPEERRIKDALDSHFCVATRFDRGHACIDYGTVARNGIRYYETKVKVELDEGLDGDKRLLLEAMLMSIDAVKTYSKRFADLARSMYNTTKEKRLLMMANALSRVPYEPSETFFEAISAVWIMHSLVPISENEWASISVGRIDSYLYPFYQRSLEEGETRENMKSYLKTLFSFLNIYGDGACAMNIGGLDKDGNDMMNELSTLLVEIEKEMLPASPIFVVRLNPKTPDEIIDSCIDKSLFTIGQPTFYGELPCRRALSERGISEAEAVDFAVNSCMGIYLPGKEIASMWGCVFNMHLPLELAINGGRGLFYDLPFEITAYGSMPTNLEDLLSAYEYYLGKLFDVVFAFNRKNAKNCAVNSPNPFLSMLTEGCIEKGLDRAVGAKYNTETVETMALVNTANAISAIDTLVFREGKYTLEQYINATKASFVGFESLLSDIKKCEKYGTANEYADGIARRLCEISAKLCKERSNSTVSFLPSLHTLTSNVRFGNSLYVTLDGRPAGAPVAKNAGPTNDVRSSNPTSLVISAAALRQELFPGGQPIDLYFDRSLLSEKEQRDKIKALIKTYFNLGGLQLHVNSVSIDVLEKAYEHPEEYNSLVVRIGGYSRRFNELSNEVKREFIDRFKRERG